MTPIKLNIVRFAPRGENSFYATVIANVNEYFQRNNISPYANATMWIKTIVMLSLYFAPYVFIVTGQAAGNVWLFFGLWIIMAAGMIGIGTSVMHDAQHGTYSQAKWVNSL
jgi:linoleoyl-CoA desaturase